MKSSISLSDDELKIKVAEKRGFVWYKRRSSIRASDDYWGETQLAYPPEEGVAFKGWIGTVSETRFCTDEEIQIAKASRAFNGLSIPNYPHDLNACHEMVARLNQTQAETFWEHLRLIRVDEGNPELEDFREFDPFYATARQICIAFLKTVIGEK